MQNFKKIAIQSALLLSAVLPLTFLACKGQIQTLGVQFSLETHQLSNGLRIVFLEDHTVPMVSYQTWFKVGSADEVPGKTGLAHLFEHLMFKGTAKYGPKEFFNQIETKGASLNAFTTRDYTAYYEDIQPELLEKVIDMESDRMHGLILTDEVLQTEKNVVLEERRMRLENSPDGKLEEAVWALAFKDHAYRFPVIGLPTDLMAFTLDDLKDFYDKYYQPENAVVVVAGHFDAKKTLAWIKKSYGSIEGKKVKRNKIIEEEEQLEERRLTLYDDVASQKFVHAYHVPSAHSEDSYILDVLAAILFEGQSSRAYRRLVLEKDLLLGIGGAAYTPNHPGLLLIHGTLRSNPKETGALDLVETEISDLIRAVQKTGVTQEEVKKAVKQLSVQMLDGVRTPHGLAQFMGTVMMIFDDPGRYAKDLEKYLRVTPAEVKRVANTYLIPNNRTAVVIKQGTHEKGVNP